MRRPSAGFTLVEVLVAVALLGMLTVIAYSAVRISGDTWHRMRDQRGAEADRAATLRVFRIALANAYPAYSTKNANDRRIAFEGTPTELQLVTALPQAVGADFIGREHFFLARDGRALALWLGWSFDLPNAAGGLPKERLARLATSIAALNLTYFGAPEPGKPSIWWDHWANVATLPQLVRIRIWRKTAAPNPWIDLTAETKVTLNVDCAYDPIEIECRRAE